MFNQQVLQPLQQQAIVRAQRATENVRGDIQLYDSSLLSYSQQLPYLTSLITLFNAYIRLLKNAISAQSTDFELLNVAIDKKFSVIKNKFINDFKLYLQRSTSDEDGKALTEEKRQKLLATYAQVSTESFGVMQKNLRINHQDELSKKLEIVTNQLHQQQENLAILEKTIQDDKHSLQIARQQYTTERTRIIRQHFMTTLHPLAHACLTLDIDTITSLLTSRNMLQRSNNKSYILTASIGKQTPLHLIIHDYKNEFLLGSPLPLRAKIAAENQKKEAEIAKILIAHGADLNWTSKDNYTPLHLACKHGNLPLAQILITNGAKVNARGAYNRTPLHIAAHNGHYNIVYMLLRHRADHKLLAQEASGEVTPLDEAIERGYLPIVILFMKKAKITVSVSLLERAVNAGSAAVVGYFLRDKINILPNKMRTLVQCANTIKAYDVVNILLQYLTRETCTRIYKQDRQQRQALLQQDQAAFTAHQSHIAETIQRSYEEAINALQINTAQELQKYEQSLYQQYMPSNDNKNAKKSNNKGNSKKGKEKQLDDNNDQPDEPIFTTETIALTMHINPNVTRHTVTQQTASVADVDVDNVASASSNSTSLSSNSG